MFSEKALYFMPLGGSGEIGMNFNVYICDGKVLIVDAGVSFEALPGIEVIMPDVRMLKEHRKSIIGLVLTHAHEDHIGAVAYLWQFLRCPIYATPFTAFLVRRKLEEWRVKAPVNETPLAGTVDLDPFQVQFIQLTHSIPEPNALAIHTPYGTVLHTGDWKLDEDPLLGTGVDEEALKRLGDKGVLALVCDSTNVFEEGYSGSEATVRDSLIEQVQACSGKRVVVACFASNVARLLSCYEAAKATGRSLAILGNSLERMDRAARAVGYFHDIPPFLTEKELKGYSRGEILIASTGSQGEPRSALTRMAQDRHGALKLDEGDIVFFSSRVIPGNEKAISALYNDLALRGIEVVTAKRIPSLHVSGHPYQEELKKMYGWIKPKIAIPVHGEYRHLLFHAAFAESLGVPHVCVPQNGHCLHLDEKDGAVLVDEAPIGQLALDGNRLVPVEGNVLRERKQIMHGGQAQVSILMRNRKRSWDKQLSVLGVVESGEKKSFMPIFDREVDRALGRLTDHEWSNDQKVREILKRDLGQFFFKRYRKKPMISVHVLRDA